LIEPGETKLAAVEKGKLVRQDISYESSRLGREQDLRAVAGGRNTRGLMNGDRHVLSVRRRCGDASVQADPHSNATVWGPGKGLQRSLGIDARGKSICRVTKGYKKAIALATELDSTVIRYSFPQDAAMLLQHTREPVAQSPKQLGRPFNIGEDKGDIPGWQPIGHRRLPTLLAAQESNGSWAGIAALVKRRLALASRPASPRTVGKRKKLPPSRPPADPIAPPSRLKRNRRAADPRPILGRRSPDGRHDNVFEHDLGPGN
jgi:hypothetical protein